MNTSVGTREGFIEYLRDALTHLYHVDYLRKSPLIYFFGLSEKFNAASTLREILMEGIEALKPSPDQPEQSRAWRIYESLFCCFVQQLSQQVVADQLCISDRQLRREQRVALEELADLLWEKYHLCPGADQISRNIDTIIAQELSWVRRSCADASSQLYSQLYEVLDLCYPLAAQNEVDLKVQVPGLLPDLAVHSVALNQILLNVILDAIHHTPGGTIQITANSKDETVVLIVRGEKSQKVFCQKESENPGNVDVAQQIADLSGVEIQVATPAPFVTISLPICEEIPILAIDDNEDVLQLMHRFTSGSRFRIVPVQDPNKVFSVIEIERPRAIILDIMMPQDNGWMVLARLKQHPLTTNSPVIVCSVLPQENLAMTLGASGYLKKPFTREEFFRTLEEQIFLRGSNFRSSVE